MSVTIKINQRLIIGIEYLEIYRHWFASTFDAKEKRGDADTHAEPANALVIDLYHLLEHEAEKDRYRFAREKQN